jgi:hypothetical protein
MNPMEVFVARENIARMRQQIAVEQDGAARATIVLLLEEQEESLRGEAVEEGSVQA